MRCISISRAATAVALASSALLGLVNNNLVSADETCLCPFDKKIKIGGVSHGNVADSFWDPIYAAAERSALDSNVELDFERFEGGTVESQGTTIVEKMVDRIKKLCESSTDMNGVFSTIPDPAVLEALKSNCLANGIPTIVINNGHDLAEAAVNEDESGSTFLHFVGADDYTTGKDSGERLMSTCPECDTFYCIDHCGNCTSWFQRCRGFGDAMGSGYPEENGQITIDDTNIETYMSSIENVIGTNGTWDNIGLLAGVQSSLVGYAAELTNKYPGVKIAGIDSSPELNELLADENEGSILWGTDQQPFLQGYYPVQLLANKLRIGQNLQDFNLETGPTFVTEAPDTALLVCASNPFVNCDDTDMSSSEVKNTSSSASASGGTNMMLYGGMLCILFASYIFG